MARARQARGWTRRELAARIGHANGGYVSQLEAGKRKPRTELLLRLATALMVDVCELTDIYDPDDPAGRGARTGAAAAISAASDAAVNR